MHIIDIIVFLLFTGGVVAFGCSFFNLKSASNLNGNLNCSKELEHYAS